MFIALWDYGLPLNLKAESWREAVQEALKVSAEDTNRDDLRIVMWKEIPQPEDVTPTTPPGRYRYPAHNCCGMPLSGEHADQCTAREQNEVFDATVKRVRDHARAHGWEV